jgi:L-ascorbate metabolism protein UlaG (beta-lactamase superfamily)
MLRSLLTACLLLAAAAASGQDRRPSHCIAIANAAPGLEYLQLAGFRDPVPEFSVRITYIDHAMFLLQTPGGLSAVTDYRGFLGTTDLTPTVATMNNAHGTHWTQAPDPDIPHLLEGWAMPDDPRDHHLDLGEMLVRNVHTDVRAGFGDVRPNGNSIFIFEVEGLCIGHLGHLHHYPDDAQLAAIGRLDVVMAAVDGGTTLDLPTMIRLLKRLKSSVVIPMHWFSTSTLDRFLAGMADEFAIRRDMPHEIEVSLRTLPDRPTVIPLSPAFLTEPE